ncbi:MAG: hypothetical protein AAFU67_18145, partial [Bacteroidota bacterium]
MNKVISTSANQPSSLGLLQFIGPLFRSVAKFFKRLFGNQHPQPEGPIPPGPIHGSSRPRIVSAKVTVKPRQEFLVEFGSNDMAPGTSRIELTLDKKDVDSFTDHFTILLPDPNSERRGVHVHTTGSDKQYSTETHHESGSGDSEKTVFKLDGFAEDFFSILQGDYENYVLKVPNTSSPRYTVDDFSVDYTEVLGIRPTNLTTRTTPALAGPIRGANRPAIVSVKVTVKPRVEFFGEEAQSEPTDDMPCAVEVELLLEGQLSVYPYFGALDFVNPNISPVTYDT